MLTKQSRAAFGRLSTSWKVAVIASLAFVAGSVWIGLNPPGEEWSKQTFDAPSVRSCKSMFGHCSDAMELNRARMVCAQVYGNERGYYNARFEYNRLAQLVGVPTNDEPFRTPPQYVAAAVAQLGSCPVPL